MHNSTLFKYEEVLKNMHNLTYFVRGEWLVQILPLRPIIFAHKSQSLTILPPTWPRDFPMFLVILLPIFCVPVQNITSDDVSCFGE